MGKTKKEGVKAVVFTLSPTGVFGLAYHVGETAEIDADQAALVIEANYAREATEEEIKEYEAAQAEQ